MHQNSSFKSILLRAVVFLLLSPFFAQAQSLELMAGHERIFADVQWLKPLDKDYRWTVFSRTRATVDYDNNTNLFSGAYLNYTRPSGLGISLVGKISNAGGGADAGLHIFKSKPKWMLFGLASVGLKSKLEYSWFSILRFTPDISEKWKLYSSLELFSLFNKAGHVLSVQRIRLGVNRNNYQFGLALNLSEIGTNFTSNSNVGGFIRKSF